MTTRSATRSQTGDVRALAAGAAARPGLVLAYPQPDSATHRGSAAEAEVATVDRAVGVMLARCDAEISAATLCTDPVDRFLHAHFAALRCAGALLEARGRARVRGRGRNVWDLVSEFVPEAAHWAAAFARAARVRAAIEAGDVAHVDDAAADEALAAAEDFRDHVATLISQQEGRRRGARAS